MDQFSHDLTLALEETSRVDVIGDRWGHRRRTRSTGNLPSAPQPTEDSSSSPTDVQTQNVSNNQTPKVLEDFQLMHSDSDDRTELPHSLKNVCSIGNFESDSLNEHFSPTRFFRPNIRRKRKLKRMATEFETSAMTTCVGGEGNMVNSLYAVTGAVKKKVVKVQDCYRTNLFFCGKRKRSHRDRYYDNDCVKQHSSSVPRQTHFYAFHQLGFLGDNKVRTKSFSSSRTPKNQLERIMPLNEGLISKIEKISQRQTFSDFKNSPSFTFGDLKVKDDIALKGIKDNTNYPRQSIALNINQQKKRLVATNKGDDSPNSPNTTDSKETNGKIKKSYNKNGKLKLKACLQFDDPSLMECGEFAEFLSSSSISSSDSDDVDTNDSDREGDDELTDWPGSELVINFASKNDFKRKLTKKPILPQIKAEDSTIGADDDTLMSGDDSIMQRTPVLSTSHELFKSAQSAPIAINNSGDTAAVNTCESMQQFRFPIKQIESEMSGETSNPFLASPPIQPDNVREIRAGCRRIKDGRPGFSIKTSINEHLARFLQDGRQTELRLSDIDVYERDSLANLAKLYSLKISEENGCASFTKTSNTTQSVEVDHQLQKCFSLSDYKRRCYGDQFVTKVKSTEDAVNHKDKDFLIKYRSNSNIIASNSNR